MFSRIGASVEILNCYCVDTFKISTLVVFYVIHGVTSLCRHRGGLGECRGVFRVWPTV